MTRVLATAYISSLVVGSALTAPESQPSPSLDNVLDRASAYVLRYGETLSTVLAAESYTQRLVWRRTGQPLSERRLRSEIAFVRLVDSTEWLAFRNVLAVNHADVLESAGRLERLFQRPPQSLLAQARSIAQESARYNLGPITRQIVTPMSLRKPCLVNNCQPSSSMVRGSARKVLDTKPPKVAYDPPARNRMNNDMPRIILSGPEIGASGFMQVPRVRSSGDYGGQRIRSVAPPCR